MPERFCRRYWHVQQRTSRRQPQVPRRYWVARRRRGQGGCQLERDLAPQWPCGGCVPHTRRAPAIRASAHGQRRLTRHRTRCNTGGNRGSLRSPGRNKQRTPFPAADASAMARTEGHLSTRREDSSEDRVKSSCFRTSQTKPERRLHGGPLSFGTPSAQPTSHPRLVYRPRYPGNAPWLCTAAACTVTGPAAYGVVPRIRTFCWTHNHESPCAYQLDSLGLARSRTTKQRRPGWNLHPSTTSTSCMTSSPLRALPNDVLRVAALSLPAGLLVCRLLIRPFPSTSIRLHAQTHSLFPSAPSSRHQPVIVLILFAASPVSFALMWMPGKSRSTLRQPTRPRTGAQPIRRICVAPRAL